jgi:ketosteroid isomerase-like protein
MFVSEANVEAVRRGVEAFSRADWEKSLELMDPDIEWHDAPDLPGAQVHRGREGVLAQWKGMREALEGFTVEAERYFDAGDEVVVFLTSGGRGRASGVPVSRELAQVVTVRNGRATKIVGHTDRAEALEAAGLSRDVANA